MEKKKVDLTKFAEDTGKGLKNFLGKTKDTIVNAVDQNADGIFDKEDVSNIAGKFSDAAKNTATVVKEKADETSKELARKALKPIFAEDLVNDFQFPKLIRITEIDKKHAENEVCINSIGHHSIQKDLKVLNIYSNTIDAFGLTFYPDVYSEIYYVDPTDRNKYIALDDYFNYLKKMRIVELENIAHDLGAKHYKITYMEERKSFVSEKTNAFIKKKGDSVEATHEREASQYTNMFIESEEDFPGKNPVMPKLQYLKNDPDIISLINKRMDTISPTQHQKKVIKLISTSGIKANDALKIDGALKAMKISGNASLSNEVQNESRRCLQYEIDY